MKMIKKAALMMEEVNEILEMTILGVVHMTDLHINNYFGRFPETILFRLMSYFCLFVKIYIDLNQQV